MRRINIINPKRYFSLIATYGITCFLPFFFFFFSRFSFFLSFLVLLVFRRSSEKNLVEGKFAKGGRYGFSICSVASSRGWKLETRYATKLRMNLFKYQEETKRKLQRGYRFSARGMRENKVSRAQPSLCFSMRMCKMQGVQSGCWWYWLFVRDAISMRQYAAGLDEFCLPSVCSCTTCGIFFKQ